MREACTAPWGVLVLLAALAPQQAAAGQVTDEGVFSIRVNGREIGREEFSVRPGRGPDGKVAGTAITAITRYPAIDPERTYTTVLERSETKRFTVFQLEFDGQGRSERYLGAQDRGRITIHRFVGTDREAREFPGGAAAYVMVDSVFALHYVLVDLASPDGTPITAYMPRTGSRRRLVATTVPGGAPTVRVSGDMTALIGLDDTQHIQRIEFPGTSLSVVRLRD